MFENDELGTSTPDTTTTEVENNPTETQDTPQTDPLAYEKGVKLSDKIDQNPESLTQLLELDKVEKFRWKGKELTTKDLEKGFMLQSDYTKKTQSIAEQRKQFEEQQKYSKALRFDLESVRNDPKLAENFRKLYPEEYHGYLDFILARETIKKEEDPAAANENKTPVQQAESFKDPRVDEVYNFVQEQKLQTAIVHTNATFDKLNTKYPDASEIEVIGKVQNLLALHKQNPTEFKKPDEKVIEDLFKESQEARLTFAKGYQSRLVAEQKKVNAKGVGPGAGGGIPGQAPRVAKTIKEATAFALQDLENGQF